jgi:adenylate cyclase
MAMITKLWRRKKFADYKSLFEREFDREIMKSERRRAFIVFIIACVIIIWLVIVQLFMSGYFPSIAFVMYRGHNFFTWLTIVFGALALYELFYALVLVTFLVREKMFPFFPRFVNAFVEISVPTAMTYLTFTVFGNIQALFSPVALLYFIFISLSSMRLTFTLSLFTGIVACVEYILISMHVMQRVAYDTSYPVLFSTGLHVTRGLILLSVGLITGLVSQQIKKRMKRTIKTTAEKDRIIGMFGQHVSPAVVNKLLGQKGELGSEIRYVCMLFLDIRDFTRFAEHREPEEVVGYLNTLFDFMIDIINENRGIINKFLGDGFMAVFGAPFSDGEDSRNAVDAANQIIARLEDEIRAGRIPETRVGIGIHAGEAVTGHVGSPQRKEYTIIGDVVNIASRIEQLNKTYGSRILVSEEVWKSIEKSTYRSEDMGTVDIRGHAGTVHLYKLA